MKITVHRGACCIGGCVTEYEHAGWRLFVDYGRPLPGSATADTPLHIEGLTHGDTSRSALLLTHYHEDHIGEIDELGADIPVFMGAAARKIALLTATRLGTISAHHRALAGRLEAASTFTPGRQFTFGDFTIMPVVVDHSAYDAYAFGIEAEGIKVYHSGDFRTHGFRSHVLPEVMDKYIGKVQYMVCEGTNIHHADDSIPTEAALQADFEADFRANPYNVVYASSTNVDRLFSIYHAAVRAGRQFIIDNHQKSIMDVAVKSSRSSKFFAYVRGRKPSVLKTTDNGFQTTDRFLKKAESSGYVLMARATERFAHLLEELPSAGRRTYLSMWEGYIDPGDASYSPTLAEALGADYALRHSSGHCTMKGLDYLIRQLQPRAVIPMHTEDPAAFADRFADRVPVILLNDGESFSPIVDPGFDTTSAFVLARKEPEEDLEETQNPFRLKWWSADKRFLGEFACWDEAVSAARHAVYAPERALGSEVDSEEDMAPWLYVVYNSDFTELATYEEGGHAPEECGFGQPAAFGAGEKVLALIPDMDALVPAVVVGPLTEDYVRGEFENDEYSTCSSYEEYIEKFWDWDWDKTLVRPLVRIKNGMRELGDVEAVQRIYLFPYRD